MTSDGEREYWEEQSKDCIPQSGSFLIGGNIPNGKYYYFRNRAERNKANKLVEKGERFCPALTEGVLLIYNEGSFLFVTVEEAKALHALDYDLTEGWRKFKALATKKLKI